MDESILSSVKSKIGMLDEYTEFDGPIIDYINSVFMVLKQIGVGPTEGFYIKDATAVWTDFMDESAELNGVKTYVGQKAKLMFDPPQSSALLQALKESIAEFEWRLNIAVDPGEIREEANSK